MMKKKNTSSQIENLSEVDVTPENVTLSGARALAHLFLLEQDFRQVKTPDQLSKLVVSRLNGFIDYDAILFWVGGKQQKIKIVRISGFDNKLEGKLINEWGMRSAKWLNKLNKSMTEIDHTMIKEYVFDVWPEVFPMQGLYIPIAMPEQKNIGGMLILREQEFAPPIKIMLEQMTGAIAYSLRGLELNIHKKYKQKPSFLNSFLMMVIILAMFGGTGYYLLKHISLLT